MIFKCSKSFLNSFRIYEVGKLLIALYLKNNILVYYFFYFLSAGLLSRSDFAPLRQVK